MILVRFLVGKHPTISLHVLRWLQFRHALGLVVDQDAMMGCDQTQYLKIACVRAVQGFMHAGHGVLDTGSTIELNSQRRRNLLT